jgi:hypothetical protein
MEKENGPVMTEGKKKGKGKEEIAAPRQIESASRWFKLISSTLRPPSDSYSHLRQRIWLYSHD